MASAAGSAPYDLVIRGGTVFDGLDGAGALPGDGAAVDVAIKDGRIAEIGTALGKGAEEIEARGKIVTPGFVDIHTHYDGQATWDQRLQPSSWHGVTTAVMGNCGVGFAPCRPEDHDRLVRLMEGVEDIPGVVLTEGLKWDWETFPEFLSALERLDHDIDFAAQVPHGALRVYVMGERGANRDPATPEDIAEMARLAREGVEAGGLGFTTSRTLNHRTSDGQPTPTIGAAAEELVGIAKGLGAAGKGVLQVVSDFDDPEAEYLMLRRMVEESGRPLSVSLAQSERAPEGWRLLLAGIEAAQKDGLPMRAQVCGRPVGLLLGLELTLNPFSAHPSFQAIKDRPLADKIAAFRDPEFRARLLSEEPVSQDPFVKAVLLNFGKMFDLGTPPDYEPTPDRSVGAVAAARGTSPEEIAIEAMLANAGKGQLYFPFLNYAEGSLDPSYDMMRSPATVLGLSDGGAHVGMICDGSFPTSMLTHWTRDRVRGPKLRLGEVIRMQTAETARAVGLLDRGYLAPGMKADVNVIDYDGMTLHAPQVVFDLPAGGKRLIQKVDGYTATIVSGRMTYRGGDPTGALPGKLVRGAQAAPAGLAQAAE